MANAVFVDSVWVMEHLDDPMVAVIDVRPPAFYAQEHLPGAGNLPGFFLSGPGGLPPPMETLAPRLEALGISRETHVVAYDDGASPAAARLYWVLTYYRHPSVSILDGGITRWRHEGRDVVYTPEVSEPAAYERLAADESVLARIEDVRSVLNDPRYDILDVRSPREYLGLQTTAARDGHIPGAMNVDWVNNLEQRDGTPGLRSRAELQAIYQDAGALTNHAVVVYCQSGQRAAHTFAVLRALGFDNVALYAPGWQEWGNLKDTPVES
jgi:thiosulfate/3-mercaptopyruvate sulfurtransferase